MGKALFDAAPLVVARVAVLPADHADSTRIALDPEGAGYPQRLVAYLRDLIAPPVVREAIEVSSTSLSETLDKICSGAEADVSKVERAVLAASRYVLRMSSRPTPFGLMAGLATGSFDRAAKVRIGTDHTRFVRVDHGWIYAQVARWQRRPDLRQALRVTANDLAAVRGDRLVLDFRHGAEHESAAPVRDVSVRFTPVVAAAMADAARPIGYPELAARLRGAFPAATEDAVERLLADLVERGFLLTDLTPHPGRGDPAAQLRATVPGTDVDDLLGRIHEAIEEYRATPIGGGRPAFRAATAMLSEQRRLPRPPLQVELRYDIDFRLPWQVAREAEKVVSALHRMSRQSPYHAHLVEYHQDFLERYGTEEAVPVLELLDPHRGLGAPAGYRVPESHRRPRIEHSGEPGADRAELLAALAWEAATSGSEVVLDERMVDRLGRGVALPPPEVVELCVQLFAGTAAGLDRGDFTMAVAPIGGALRPGQMFGRFAEMLGVESTLSDLVAATGTDAQAMQVFSHSTVGRAVNVASAPQLVRHSLPIGMFADHADRSVIDIADVGVGATTGHLYLTSLRTGRSLRPLMPHMLNLESQMPNAARLLMDVEESGRGMHWWTWERLETLPSLPRVRYGRTIIARARWRPDPELATVKEPWPRWCDRLARWRDTWHVPARVEATFYDQRVELDLDADLHRRLLHQALRKYGGVLLYESLAAQRSRLGWLEGRAAEFVVTLTRSAAAQPVEEPVVPPVLRSTARHEPGGEWLYAKLYAVESAQDQIVTRELPALVADLPDGVARWFFMRYRDPEPHVRLRLHGDPDVLWRLMLPRLRQWAAGIHERGLAGELRLDTYRPEVSRYGGPELMAPAEELFCADSVSVIGQLRVRARALRDLPIEVLAAMNFVDLLRSLGEWNWAEWAVHEIARRPLTGMDRAHIALVDPAGSWEGLAGLAGGRELMSCWEHRSRAGAALGRRLLGGDLPSHRVRSVVASLLHMHTNRLFGLNRPAEERALALLRSRAHSLRARPAGRA